MMDVGCRMSDVGKREAGVRGMEGTAVCGARGGEVRGVQECARVRCLMFTSGSGDGDDSGKDGQEQPER